MHPKPRSLTVWFDADCSFCTRVAAWLRAQPKFVPLRCVAAQAASSSGCPLGTKALLEKITVTADDGAVWRGSNAWIVVLWALREDGRVLSLTYRPEQQLYAWARHDFGGTVESIAVVPSSTGATDDLWMIVKRVIAGEPRRFIEILAPPFEPTDPLDRDSMGFLDAALRYRGAV